MRNAYGIGFMEFAMSCAVYCTEGGFSASDCRYLKRGIGNRWPLEEGGYLGFYFYSNPL